MVTETVNIVTRETGARVIKRRFDEIGQSADRATRGLFLMQRALFVIGGAGAVAGLSKQADALTNMENKLRLTTKSTAELERVQSQLFKAANAARSDIAGVSQIYTRTALSVKGLGLNTKETIKFTESLAKATVISGASAQEANAALIQLGQGMASNRLSGDELRSILEQLPYVADIIAKHMGVTRGELRELGKDGKISAQVILDAFSNAEAEIDKVFANTIPTISQAFAMAKNNALSFLDAFDDATGASAKVAQAIIALSKNFDTLAGSAAVTAAVILGLYGDRLLRAIGTALSAQVAYSRAVSSGDVILLNSARAEQLRTQSAVQMATAKHASAQAEVANTAATITGIQTRIADIQATRGQLIATLGLIEAQKTSQAFTVVNGRARMVATGQFVNQTAAQTALNNSTRALIVTKRALAATDAQLALATGSLTMAQSAANVAAVGAAATQTALGTATAAAAAQAAYASTIWGRLALTFPMLTAAINAAGAALARFGAFLMANPFTVALVGITALSYYLMTLKSNADKVQESFNDLKTITDSLESAFEKSGRTAQVFNREMSKIGESNVLLKQAEAAKQLEDVMGDITKQTRFFTANKSVHLFNLDGMDEDEKKIQDVIDTFNDGNLSVQDFAQQIDKLAASSGNTDLQEFASKILAISATFTTAEETLAFYNAMLAQSAGTATLAQQELLRLHGVIEDLNEIEIPEGNLKAIEDMGDKVSNMLDGLKDNFGEVSDDIFATSKSVDELTRGLEGMSISGLTLDIQNSAAQIDAAFASMSKSVDSFLTDTANMAIPPTMVLEIMRLDQEFQNNNISAKELLSTLDSMAVTSGNSNFMALVNSLQQQVAAADAAGNSTEFLEAMLRLLTGTASAADRVLLGVASAMDSITGSANAAASAMQFFIDKIPAMKEAARIQSGIAQANAHLGAAKAEIAGRVASGTISADAAASELARFTDLHGQAISEIDGSAEALRDVNGELKNYSTQAGIANRTGLDRTLHQKEIEYNKLRDAAVAAGAGQAELNKLEQDYQTIRAAAERDDAAKGAKKGKKKGGGAQKKDFASELREIQDEIELLQLAGRERRIYAGILKMEKELKRELTDSEKALAAEALKSLDIAKAQASILDQLRGPQEALIDRQAALNQLFRDGSITLNEYLQGLKDIQQGMDEASNTIAGGFRSSISDAIMTTGELGKAMGDIVVGAAGKAADALVEFAKTGKLAIRELFFELFAQLFKLMAQQMMLRFVASLLGIPLPPMGMGAVPVPGAATGASVMPTGPGSTDTQMMMFKKRPDERVDILTPAQQRNQRKRVLHEIFGTTDVETIASGGLNRVPAIVDTSGRALAGGAGSGSIKAATDPMDLIETNRQIHYGNFARGGSISPSGPGSTDTQLVSFNKRPDERVDILTPAQQQDKKDNAKRETSGEETKDAGTNIINVLDPSIVGQYLQTSNGRKVMINILGEEGVI